MTDPRPEDRIWYRHHREGTRGYLVTREGKRCIKLDRPQQSSEFSEVVQPFIEGNWIPERENRPCTRAGIARVAFEADKALCIAIGEHVLGRREWLNLKDEQRIDWMAGHKKPPAELKGSRRELYIDVMKRLEPIATE